MVVTSWKTQEMQFELNGKVVKLVGDPTLARSQISLKAMFRTIRKEGGGLWLELSQLEGKVAETEADEVVPEFVQEVLGRFSGVFEAPTGLPPRRGHEHSITLRGGSNPVSVRPYRYPQFQKDEIERLIKEMLAAQIIIPSTSPFSSPDSLHSNSCNRPHLPRE